MTDALAVRNISGVRLANGSHIDVLWSEDVTVDEVVNDGSEWIGFTDATDSYVMVRRSSIVAIEVRS